MRFCKWISLCSVFAYLENVIPTLFIPHFHPQDCRFQMVVFCKGFASGVKTVVIFPFNNYKKKKILWAGTAVVCVKKNCFLTFLSTEFLFLLAPFSVFSRKLVNWKASSSQPCLPFVSLPYFIFRPSSVSVKWKQDPALLVSGTVQIRRRFTN